VLYGLLNDSFKEVACTKLSFMFRWVVFYVVFFIQLFLQKQKNSDLDSLPYSHPPAECIIFQLSLHLLALNSGTDTKS
jgi:hypothetical protein